jgi:hypothetical protein
MLPDVPPSLGLRTCRKATSHLPSFREVASLSADLNTPRRLTSFPILANIRFENLAFEGLEEASDHDLNAATMVKRAALLVERHVQATGSPV